MEKNIDNLLEEMSKIIGSLERDGDHDSVDILLKAYKIILRNSDGK